MSVKGWEAVFSGSGSWGSRRSVGVVGCWVRFSVEFRCSIESFRVVVLQAAWDKDKVELWKACMVEESRGLGRISWTRSLEVALD